MIQTVEEIRHGPRFTLAFGVSREIRMDGWQQLSTLKMRTSSGVLSELST